MFILRRTVLFSVCLAFACACHPKPAAMTEKEIQYMQTLTKKMTARCVGRYLVDVPEDMVLNSEGGQQIEEARIDIKPMSEPEFELILARRKNELENTVIRGKEKYPLLKKTLSLPNKVLGLLFDHAENPDTGGRLSRMLELFAWKSGYHILATIKATDTGFPEDANDPLLQTLTTTTPKQLAILLSILERTSGRADSEIPTGQGVCTLNGFIRGPASDEESVTVFYHLKTARDVFFRINTASSYSRMETLVERGKKVEPIIAQGEGTTLRRAKRAVAGASDGEEFLYKMLDDPNSEGHQVMAHKFVFEANSKIGSAKTPLISIEFDNGTMKPMPEQDPEMDAPPPITKATLSEAEALALWDAVIPTIRPRPGAF
jgi:hypothetical protein